MAQSYGCCMKADLIQRHKRPNDDINVALPLHVMEPLAETASSSPCTPEPPGYHDRILMSVAWAVHGRFREGLGQGRYGTVHREAVDPSGSNLCRILSLLSLANILLEFHWPFVSSDLCQPHSWYGARRPTANQEAY